jgi:hypothetical protein
MGLEWHHTTNTYAKVGMKKEGFGGKVVGAIPTREHNQSPWIF